MQFRGTQKNAISRAETYAFFNFLKRFVEKKNFKWKFNLSLISREKLSTMDFACKKISHSF